MKHYILNDGKNIRKENKIMDVKEVKIMYKQQDVELTILFDQNMPEYILLHGERVRHYDPKKLEHWIKMLSLIDSIIGQDKRQELQDMLLEEWYNNEISKKLKEREQITTKNIMETNYYEESENYMAQWN